MIFEAIFEIGRNSVPDQVHVGGDEDKVSDGQEYLVVRLPDVIPPHFQERLGVDALHILDRQGVLDLSLVGKIILG